MSWDSYIDNLTSDENIITQATIIGLNGGLWTPGPKPNIFAISAKEAQRIGTLMSAGDSSPMQEEGITINAIRYMLLRDMDKDGRIITGKKAGVGNIVMHRSKQAVIIAHIPEKNNSSAGAANQKVETIVNYLETVGY